MSNEFETEAERLFDCAHNNIGWRPIEESLRRAYASGLQAMRAKCEAIADVAWEETREPVAAHIADAIAALKDKP